MLRWRSIRDRICENEYPGKQARSNLLPDTTGPSVSDQCAFMQVTLRGCLMAGWDATPALPEVA
jgi:hypothetical protein